MSEIKDFFIVEAKRILCQAWTGEGGVGVGLELPSKETKRSELEQREETHMCN